MHETSKYENQASQRVDGTSRAVDDLVGRAAGEYREMPGMCVTARQAQRLWGLDSTTCELVLAALVERGVVRQTRGGMYVKS